MLLIYPQCVLHHACKPAGSLPALFMGFNAPSCLQCLQIHKFPLVSPCRWTMEKHGSQAGTQFHASSAIPLACFPPISLSSMKEKGTSKESPPFSKHQIFYEYVDQQGTRRGITLLAHVGGLSIKAGIQQPC